MNRWLISAIAATIFSCSWDNKISKDHEKVWAPSIVSLGRTSNIPYKNKKIDPSKSMVSWAGTKLMGTGSHEGTITFINGELQLSDSQLVGGYFTVDMKSICITDIPLSDPEPRRNLTSHLNHDFETQRFPEAVFKILQTSYYENDSVSIIGVMEIKGISKRIAFSAFEVISGKEFETSFTINRFDWGIGENGSWLEKKLVDDLINLNIRIVVSD